MEFSSSPRDSTQQKGSATHRWSHYHQCVNLLIIRKYNLNDKNSQITQIAFDQHGIMSSLTNFRLLTLRGLSIWNRSYFWQTTCFDECIGGSSNVRHQGSKWIEFVGHLGLH